MTDVLVGTKKGLFVLRGDRPDAFEVVHRAFPGDVVEFATRDPRSGRYFASVTSGHFGPRLLLADDPTGEWTPAEGLAFPDHVEDTLERIWTVVPGETEGELWAGVAPAALFRSTDGGERWTFNEALWAERVAGDWQPGAGGLALHSICPWPGEPRKLAIGISAAGVWLTDDGGDTWRTGYPGLVPLYMPEEMREGTNALCVHNMRRAPRRPERLFLQFHGSVYRSDDAGSTWNDVAAGLPSGFGFPIEIDPADPDSAYVIPLIADLDRVTPDERLRVFETRDGGDSWTAREDGLPNSHTFLTILRQAFGTGGEGPDMALFFGATSGEVFGSLDAGRRWFRAAEHLAPVTSVRVA
jgi:photosystem II stability/assembly factor-like uncharacterized protein